MYFRFSSLLIRDYAFCVVRSFHWVLSAGGQAQLEDGLESAHLLGNYHYAAAVPNAVY